MYVARGFKVWATQLQLQALHLTVKYSAALNTTQRQLFKIAALIKFFFTVVPNLFCC